MESRSEKSIPSKGIDGIVRDRLSEMPDEVILHIMSFMPTLDAVRTMLLRRFGNFWTVVPFLRFDFGEYFYNMIWSDDDFSCVSSINEEFSCFSRFVRNVLMLHKSSTIDTFHLTVDEFEYDFEDEKIFDDVQMWLRVAIDREVKDLLFRGNGYDELVPPRCVFTTQSLATLKLSGYMLDLPPQVHMGNLRKLSLINVEGSNEAFNQLISGCPSLQELVIDGARGLRILNITSPSVCKLYLDVGDYPCSLNCPSLKVLDITLSETSSSTMLNMIDVSSLQEVNVKRLPNECSIGLVKALLRHFQNVEVFTFSFEAFEQLCCIKKMDFSQSRWKRLVLQPWWNHERCIQIIIKLVKSSVNMEELIIYAGRSSDNRELLYPELSISCVMMPVLKRVAIHGYEKCCKGQLQLVQYLLRNEVYSEKLLVTYGENKLKSVEELNLGKQVSRFRRASPNAIVV